MVDNADRHLGRGGELSAPLPDLPRRRNVRVFLGARYYEFNDNFNVHTGRDRYRNGSFLPGRELLGHHGGKPRGRSADRAAVVQEAGPMDVHHRRPLHGRLELPEHPLSRSTWAPNLNPGRQPGRHATRRSSRMTMAPTTATHDAYRPRVFAAGRVAAGRPVPDHPRHLLPRRLDGHLDGRHRPGQRHDRLPRSPPWAST